MNYFKKILRFAWPYKSYGFLNIFFNILYALFSGLSFMVLMPLLQVIFKKDTENITAAPEFGGLTNAGAYFKDYMNYVITDIAGEDKSKALIAVIILVIVVFLLKNIFNYLAMYFITFLRNGVLKDIRNELYDKTISLPLSYFSEKRKGDIMARLGTDVLEIQHSFLSILELLFREPLTIVFTIIFMLTISVKLTLFVFIFIPISGFLISIVGKSLKRRSDKVQKEQGYFLSLLEETLGGLRIIKGFNAEEQETKVFEYGVELLFQNVKKSLTATAFMTSSSTFLIGIATTGIMGIGGYKIMYEGLSLGDFLSFTFVLGIMIAPIVQMSNIGSQLTEALAGLDRTEELMNMTPEANEEERTIVLENIKGDIAFNDVSFAYEEDKDVLHNVSFEVKSGNVVALVGSSGSGKSTIAGLAATFLNPLSGTITVDGQDLSKVDLSSYRRNLGVVLQDEFLFEGTIRENIMFPRPNATEDELIKAVKAAYVDEFTDRFEKGLDTLIGERGVKLSGGQRQRIAIARAVLANPKILILDEATSNLDTESEALIQKSLATLTEGRTTFVIAHRLSTIRKANQILVIEDGRIAEKGTHDELISKEGRYYNLFTYQARI